MSSNIEDAMKVRKTTIKPGDGVTFPKKDDECAVHYTAKIAKGVVFDDSRAKKSGLYKFEVGSDRVIRGWSIGIQSMSIGERASIYIPWTKAYGIDGIENVIPPKTDLIFEIDLYRINGKGYYTTEEKEVFTKKMEEWKHKHVKQFDEKESYRTKKLKKHGTRDAFVAYLESRVKSDVDAVVVHFSELL